MKQPRILITGGAGFIGSHIADRFLAGGWAVRVIDSLEPQVHGPGGKKPDYLDPRVEFVHADICDRRAVVAALEDVDCLSHHAAAVGVGQSMYEIERYARTNALGAAVVLDAIANEKHRVKKMIVASSMSIYGEGLYRCSEHGLVSTAARPLSRLKEHHWEVTCPHCGKDLLPLPTPETKPIEPSSVYAIHKRDHEELFRVVGRAYGISTTAFRYFNTYGTRQALSNPYTGVVAIFASRLVNQKAPLMFEDGLQRRDFVSVLDVAEANWLAAASSSGDGEVFNVGSGVSVNVREIAGIVSEALRIKIAPEVTGKFREGDIRHCFADITKIKARLGWSPRRSLADEAPALAAWIQSQPAVDFVDKARHDLERRGLTR
jgi:dTDP-L-rhamnose 4-epimerase